MPPLGDLDGPVDRDVAERLADPTRRPIDIEGPDRLGLTQADRAGQGVATEARPGGDGPVARRDRAHWARQIDADLGPEGGAVGPGPHQLDRQPMVAVSRVLEQDVVGPVARGGPAGLDEDVGVAVTVPVGEGDAMPLLEVAGARRRGDVLEPSAAVVPEEHVRHQVRV